MDESLLLSLPEGVSISGRTEGGLVLHRGEDCIPVAAETPGLAGAISRLLPPGTRAAELAALILRVDEAEGPARWSTLLETLARRGLLICTSCQGSQRLASLVPTSREFTLDLRPIELDRAYVLSRFAYSRRDGDAMVLESPLSHARILLLSPSAAVLAHALARPSRAQDIAGQLPGMTVEAAAGLMALLRGSGMLSDGREEEPGALGCWEFHDLLFHARSRLGRHGRPVGPTYRFAGRGDPPPVLRAPREGEAIALDRPDLERLEREDPPLAAVQEARQSIRSYGARPLSARQLGEFLYRVARVADYREARIESPAGPIRMAFAPRPYPSAGCLHELELYVAVHACEGLAPGLYSHDPQEHRLIRLSGRTEGLDALLAGAGRCAGIDASSLQVQIILASRFARLAWKYESIAYALTLKNVGVLFQTMYLAATAMNLAPCALGVGDSDAFARAAGLDASIETAVGEFLLGSKP